MQTTATVNIVVKGNIDDVVRRLNQWFLAEADQDMIPGYGYRDGSLLFWTFAKPPQEYKWLAMTS